MHTQRLEYAAHMSFIAHIWKVVLTTSPRLFCISLSSESLTCQRRPREATQAHEKHGEAHGVVDPLRPHEIDLRGTQKHLRLTGLEAANIKLSLKPHESWMKAIFGDIRLQNWKFQFWQSYFFKRVGWLCSVNHSSSREHFQMLVLCYWETTGICGSTERWVVTEPYHTWEEKPHLPFRGSHKVMGWQQASRLFAAVFWTHCVCGYRVSSCMSQCCYMLWILRLHANILFKRFQGPL